MKYVPRAYQSLATRWLLDHPDAALFADPGLGKTAATLDYLDRLWWEADHPPRALVIAPLRVCLTVWRQEALKWDAFHAFDFHLLHGPGKETRAASGREGVYLLNCENIEWFFRDEMWGGFDFLIVDESSKFKDSSAKRTKILRKYRWDFGRRVILTGTPAPQSFIDLYSQISILDGGEALGRNVTAFRRAYLRRVSCYSYSTWEPLDGAARRVQEAIAPLVLRLDQQEHLELPELLENDVVFDLPPDARRIYRQLERDLFAALEVEGGGAPWAHSLGSKGEAYNACRQVASGRLYRNDGSRTVEPMHGARVAVLKDLLEELQGKPALVAYHYQHALAAVREAFPRAVVLGSDTPAAKVAEVVDAWNAGKIPLLLGHPQAIGHGLNLQSGPGRDIIWFDLTDSLENYEQFNRRIYRQGVGGNVRIHRIIARGTVDEDVVARIKSKGANQRTLLEFFRARLALEE